MRLSPTRAMASIAVALGLWEGASGVGPGRVVLAESAPSSSAYQALGKQLFHRKFIPNDPRCHGGDGLGPLYNDVSCVACHNLGGSGGAGSNARNVEILTPFTNSGVPCGNATPDPSSGSSSDGAASSLVELVRRETGLPSVGSVVVHRFGTRPEYRIWRSWLLERNFPGFSLRVSKRNTPALFGTGLIDAIPNSVLEKAALRRFAEFPEVKGRIARLKDGRIGRFGWKAQMATLDDFVLTACSVELGLEVPGHHQSSEFREGPRGQSAELDLTAGECLALITYVRTLPAPAEATPTAAGSADKVLQGGALFKSIGCAACHTPTLGSVDGIYSDLLLHDMGPEVADTGSYSSSPGALSIDPPDSLACTNLRTCGTPKEQLGATAQEWRTPPLWGIRDSAPYLHDGRAKSLEQAIAKHGGEAQESAARFARLRGPDQLKIRAFLMSLGAPKLAR